MIGVGWLDWLAVAAFATVTAFSLVRLVAPGRLERSGRPDPPDEHFRDDAFHAVMGVAMVAMFWPAGALQPDPAWIAVIGVTAVWPLLVFARAAQASRVSRSARASRLATGRAGYYLASALVMIVAFGAGPGSMAAGHLGPMAMGSPSSGLQAAKAAVDQSALAAAAGWPIWPIIGTAFILYGAWLAVDGRRRRRPPPQLACTMVMAAGMALMAFWI